MLIGALVSLLLWVLGAGIGHYAAAFAAREKILAPRWELLASFLVASGAYYLLRYRLALFAGDYFTVREFFGAGSFLAPERMAFLFSLPILLAASVLKPSWLTHPLVRLGLVILVPVALKFLCVYAGLTPWEGLGERLSPEGVS